MTECEYDLDDDSYGPFAGVHCILEKGHDGPHRSTFEWETRPFDICLEKGHEWGEWEAIPADRMNFWPEPIRKATKQRICERCHHHEDDGEYPPNPIFPVLTPLANQHSR